MMKITDFNSIYFNAIEKIKIVCIIFDKKSKQKMMKITDINSIYLNAIEKIKIVCFIFDQKSKKNENKIFLFDLFK